MFIKKCALALLFCLLPWWAFAQFTLVVNNIPANTPSGATLYVAGNFNSWNPIDSNYRLTAQGNGEYSITFPTQIRGPILFKFTRGGWATVETQASGAQLADRSFIIPAAGPSNYITSIARWEDVGTGAVGGSAASNVRLLSANFNMPELNRSRRIWIYLPPDYNATNLRYPVIYMHDGQNLFDRNTAYGGNEWEVDETLNRLHSQGDFGCIVIGIDNGGTDRIAEYTPYANPQYGGGSGENYVRFLANTLKPYIDNNYRTLPNRENTAIMGSSLGGLISHYALVSYPNIFGKAGVFSPSYWFNSSIYTTSRTSNRVAGNKMYLLMGGREGSSTNGSASYVRDLKRMADTLALAGYNIGNEIDTVIKTDGQHSEWFWKREFAEAYQWLFSGITSVAKTRSIVPVLSAYPNPDTENGELLNVVLSDCVASYNLIIANVAGKVVETKSITCNTTLQVVTKNWPKGIYTLSAGAATIKWIKR
jgi:predicted alpha/beta superfamily hydrolase